MWTFQVRPHTKGNNLGFLQAIGYFRCPTNSDKALEVSVNFIDKSWQYKTCETVFHTSSPTTHHLAPSRNLKTF